MATATHAIPMSLCMRTATCDYCLAASNGSLEALAYMHGIKACAAHMGWAARDIAAYFHKHELVNMDDFLARFPLIGDVSIKVPRSDGSITEGAKVLPFERTAFRFVRRTATGHWVIRVGWATADEPMNKEIKVADLALSGIEVEPIMAVLESGFYKEQYDAHVVAKTASGGAGLSKEGQEELEAQQRNLGGNVCRVFVPGEGVKYVNA